jgi:hypothetical protein
MYNDADNAMFIYPAVWFRLLAATYRVYPSILAFPYQTNYFAFNRASIYQPYINHTTMAPSKRGQQQLSDDPSDMDDDGSPPSQSVSSNI